MASEKNPSIYYDRSTIGSSEELDEYGVWVKSEPQDLSSVNTDNREILFPEEDFSELAGDMPDFDETEPAEVSPDMEDLADFNINDSFGSDISAGEDDLNLFGKDEDFTFDDIPEESAISGAGSEEASLEDNASGDDLIYRKGALDKLLQEAEAEAKQRIASDMDGDDLVYRKGALDKLLREAEAEAEAKQKAASGKDGGDSGDDLIYRKGALDKLLREAETEQPAHTPQDSSEAGSSGELSTQLLMKIAEELSSIKNELSSLKKELHQVRNEDGEVPAANGGFFDEEDDEKIALTGDELNNILNTADFTEETGADATRGETSDAGTPLVIPGAEDAGDSFSEIDTLDLSETGTAGENFPDFNETVDISIEDDKIFPELEQLREEGVELMTPAPEDTSFLTEEVPGVSDLPEDISFESSLDFDGAVIEEPDLSAELKENPIAEPSLENISLELDMEDTAKEDEAEAPNDDLDLSLEDSENIELSLDDLDDSNELIPDDLSLDDISLGTSDLSFDDAIDVPTIEENPDDDMYDQVIPEGFLVESEDGQTPEEILGNDEILETAEEFTLDDALDIEDVPTGASIQLDSVAEEAKAEITPQAGGVVEEDTAEVSPPVESELETPEETPKAPEGASPAIDVSAIPPGIKDEIRSVLSYMDQLLESLPENKIEEFAKSEHFVTYKKLFEEFDLV
jgi:hypothetical protein